MKESYCGACAEGRKEGVAVFTVVSSTRWKGKGTSSPMSGEGKRKEEGNDIHLFSQKKGQHLPRDHVERKGRLDGDHYQFSSLCAPRSQKKGLPLI